MRTAWFLVALCACGRVGFDGQDAGAGGDSSGVGDGGTTGDGDVPSYNPVCTPSCDQLLDYCSTAIGDCAGVPSCQPLADLCEPDFQPVCGCDGVTYRDTCAAGGAQMGIATLGACGGGTYVPNCSPPCSPGDYCGTSPGMCGSPGTCTPIPAPGTSSGCNDLLVCGCDGVTYGNACVAEEAGMSLADANSPCPQA
ncbi:MAG TPA: hypothetical protein VM513_18160 [Kofleriaceae bacterium]|nr:hypothetical protein [Kofleriaceae bacterium]